MSKAEILAFTSDALANDEITAAQAMAIELILGGDTNHFGGAEFRAIDWSKLLDMVQKLLPVIVQLLPIIMAIFTPKQPPVPVVNPVKPITDIGVKG